MTNLPPFPESAKIESFNESMMNLEKYQNALAFIFDAIIDDKKSFHELQDLDEGSIDDFGDDFDFDRSSYFLALDHLAQIRAS